MIQQQGSAANLLDAIGRNLERLLRWVYPGALFLVLLRLSRPHDFTALDNQGSPSLVAAGLVAGVVIYLVHAYFANHLITLVFQLLNWSVHVGLQIPVYQNAPKPRKGLRRLAGLFDRHAISTWGRWGGELPERLGNYFDYAWGTYHAVMITGWLLLVSFYFKEEASLFADVDAWKVLAPAGSLLFGGLWTYAHLSRVPFRKP